MARAVKFENLGSLKKSIRKYKKARNTRIFFGSLLFLLLFAGTAYQHLLSETLFATVGRLVTAIAIFLGILSGLAMLATADEFDDEVERLEQYSSYQNYWNARGEREW